jgi:hypothetical protein
MASVGNPATHISEAAPDVQKDLRYNLSHEPRLGLDRANDEDGIPDVAGNFMRGNAYGRLEAVSALRCVKTPAWLKSASAFQPGVR